MAHDRLRRPGHRRHAGLPGFPRGADGGRLRPGDRRIASGPRRIVNEHYHNQDCKAYNDFREVLARDDIDAVLIGTPDHWHALITIEACKHGKDVYCEKPECLTIREGRAMVEAVRRYGRVFSGGSQRVLGDYGDWPRLIWGGGAGRDQGSVRRLRRSVGRLLPPRATDSARPRLGHVARPGPWRPFHDSLINGGFRPYRDYSGGGMTDWGAHRFGAAMFAAGVHQTGPTEIIPPDGKEHKLLTYRFANGMQMYHGGTDNITYKGTEGELPGKHRVPTDRVRHAGLQGPRRHLRRLPPLRATREQPFRNIEVAHRARTVCHLGNIAYWLNRPLKWDPVKRADRWRCRGQSLARPAQARTLDP